MKENLFGHDFQNYVDARFPIAEMSTAQQLEQLKGLVNQLRPPGRALMELGTKGKCIELYGRAISNRTWQRWKSQVLTRDWTYADTVCLRFFAKGRAGNGAKGGHHRYGRSELIRDINAVIQSDGNLESIPQLEFCRPSLLMTGEELEQYLTGLVGKRSQRQWRNRGVYRRRVYNSNQVQQIIENLAS